MKPRTRAMYLAVFLALTLAGCDLAKSSRDGIASAKGALDKAKLQYSCGTPTQNASVCNRIAQGVAIKDTAINALEIYCSGPQFDAGTGACQPSTDPDKKKVLADKLNAAMRQLNQIMSDLKPFLHGGK
jgi:hypothetical protein